MDSKKYKVLLTAFIVIGILLFLPACSPEPDTGYKYYDIYGWVTEYNSGDPIKDAFVYIAGQTAYTDETGYYHISNIPEGVHTWRVSADGYQGYSETIEVSSDLKVSIKLFPIGDGNVSGKVTVNNNTGYQRVDVSTASTSNNGSAVIFNKSSDGIQYKENEILVKYKNEVSTLSTNSLENNNGVQIMGTRELPDGKVKHYRIPEDKTVSEMVDYYNNLPEVEWAQPNYIYHISAIPDDEYYIYEQRGHIITNLEAAWDVEKGDNSVTVAVVDSGIIPDHPDLAGNLVPGHDFVDDDNDPTDKTPESNSGSHGTHVAGIIGAVTNNGTGVAGVNWDVNILPVRVMGTDGSGFTDVIADGIRYAVNNNVDIINLSLGVDPSRLENGSDPYMDDAINYAVNNGVIVIAAAGNGGSDSIGDSYVDYPANMDSTIAVGAVDFNKDIASFSNYGQNLDLVAPGVGIYSTWGYYDGYNYETISDYYNMSGTSMATPYVSGIAALLLANGVPSYEVRNRLTSTAVDLGGYGMGSVLWIWVG